jgi:hypothetical protein
MVQNPLSQRRKSLEFDFRCARELAALCFVCLNRGQRSFLQRVTRSGDTAVKRTGLGKRHVRRARLKQRRPHVTIFGTYCDLMVDFILIVSPHAAERILLPVSRQLAAAPEPNHRRRFEAGDLVKDPSKHGRTR